ncbi:gp436 family protein [Pseudomonas sp. D47]|uniref:gp436 family protein n=1 Tax=Pseudomonas sp. D47 TaxID=3159447 RepID=UPI00387B0EDB
MYASPAQLLKRYGAKEIAQRADDSVPQLVHGDMLKMAINGEDLSDYSPDEQSATAAVLAKVERVLQDAEQTINSYLGGRYQLPLSNAPEVLERIAGQLARYFLYDDNVTDQIEALYKDSIEFLKGVSTGRVQLGVSDKGASAQPAASAEMVSDGRVFGRGNSKGFL